VIGAGNSGCDIAVECSKHAAVTVHSTRRGYFVVPRFVFGRPADLRGERLLKMHAPVWLRRLVALRGIARTIGLPWQHGLPRPDHRLFETHPIINSELLGQIDSGAIRPADDVAAFDGRAVVFRDGRREDFDVVIAATGYQTTLPFIDCRLLGADKADGVPRLFMNLLHPGRDDIAVVGLIQPTFRPGSWRAWHGPPALRPRRPPGSTPAANGRPAKARSATSPRRGIPSRSSIFPIAGSSSGSRPRLTGGSARPSGYRRDAPGPSYSWHPPSSSVEERAAGGSGDLRRSGTASAADLVSETHGPAHAGRNARPVARSARPRAGRSASLMLQRRNPANGNLIVNINGWLLRRDEAGVSPVDSSVSRGDAGLRGHPRLRGA